MSIITKSRYGEQHASHLKGPLSSDHKFGREGWTKDVCACGCAWFFTPALYTHWVKHTYGLSDTHTYQDTQTLPDDQDTFEHGCTCLCGHALFGKVLHDSISKTIPPWPISSDLNWGCTYIFWLPQCKIAFPSAYWARPIRDLILVTPVSDHVVALVPVCTGENLTQVLMHMWRGGLSGTQIQGSLFASDIKIYIEMYSGICLGDVSY